MGKKAEKIEQEDIPNPSRLIDSMIKVDSQSESQFNPFDDIFLVHNSLPELNFSKIDTKTTFLKKKVDFPFYICPLSGGAENLISFNKVIGMIGNTFNIPIFSGNQIYALLDVNNPKQKEIEKSYRILRDESPKGPVIGNLKASDLIDRKLTANDVQKCIDMLNADAISFYLSPLLDVLLNSPKTNYAGILEKIEKLKNEISVPIIIKEYTAGLSNDVIRKGWDAGVDMFDVSGMGGTNFCRVETRKNLPVSVKQTSGDLITPFDFWGIPQLWALMDIKLRKENADIPVLLSGGIRQGDHVIKGLLFGAESCGIAYPIVTEIFEDIRYPDEKNLENYLINFQMEIKIAMLLMGFKNIKDLKENGWGRTTIFGKTLDWLKQRNLAYPLK